MCLGKIYQKTDEQTDLKTPTLDEVSFIECTDEGLVVTDLLGRTQVIEGRIAAIDFVDGKVLVIP